MIFNTTIHVTVGRKGETICRPGGWMDVAKFFLFNYVVQALTVVNTPGSQKLRSAHASLTAILLPFSGAYRAFQAMAFYRWEKQDALNIALRAQALCTPIPSKHHPTEGVLFPALSMIDVHGQHAVPPYGFLEWIGIKQQVLQPRYQLSKVPWWFAVTPLRQPDQDQKMHRTKSPLQSGEVNHHPMSQTKLSCDQNILKIFAAILQILSGLFQIYQARGNQLERYGYSAYSLTVVPYVLMSLVNLLACVCIPQYPMMYIVHYGGGQRPLPESAVPPPAENASVDGAPATITNSNVDNQPRRRSSTQPAGADSPARRRSSIHPVGPDEEPLLQDDESTAENVERQRTRSTPGEVEDGTTTDMEDEADDEWKEEAQDMVSGVVGVAYGNWDFDKRDRTLPQSETSTIIRVLIYFVAAFVISAPYLIMQLLTGFEIRQSTRTQRSWILAWLILGQVGGLLSGAWENDYWRVMGRLPRSISPIMTRLVISSLIVASLSVGTIGGFVVVGKMILEDQVCTVI